MLAETATPPRGVRTNVGLLGNDAIQSPVWIADLNGLLADYRKILVSAQPAFKLAALKRQKFSPDGRQARIAASLAALNAAQPTNLSLAQWKQVVEEIEDED
jgi:hypothetical protein